MNPARFAFLRRNLGTRLIVALTQMFNGLGSWHRPDAQRFAATAVPMVEGAQAALAALTANYVASVASEALRRPVAPPPIPATARARLRLVDPSEVYQRPFVAAYTTLKDGQQLDQALGSARLRLREVAEGDMQLAYAHSAQAAMQGLPDGQRPTGWRRVLTGEENCAMCVIAATQVYRRSDLNPIHPSCVPAGTWAAADGLMAVTRRRYTGELVVITTSDADDELAVTPNHPVLTDQGWIPAHLIREGDDVVRSRRSQRAVGGGPNERHGPTMVEDVWRAVSMAGLVRMPLSAEDFHGDGSDGEVDVVWTDGDLAFIGDVSVAKKASERTLVTGRFARGVLTTDRSAASGLPALFATADSIVGSDGLRSSLLGGHLCGTHQASLRAVSSGDVEVLKRQSDRCAANAVFCGEGQLGLTTEVLISDLLMGQLTPRATSTRFDPPTAEFTSEGRSTYTRLGRSLLNRLTGEVDLNRVVHVRNVSFSDHVYNLHTAEGWYSANGLIVSNCDCTVQPIFGPIADRVLDTQLLNQVHAAVQDLTGVSDRGGRGVDYRQIMTQIVHHHGELGRVLARPGDRFTGPRSIPAAA